MLKKRLFAGNGLRVYELEGALMNRKQQEHLAVDYISKLTKMWNELVNYEKSPDCCCGSLTYKSIIDGERQREEK